MNKEIIKRLKDSLDYEFQLSFKDRKQLLDYITNLQQEIQTYKRLGFKHLAEKNKELQQENEKLNNIIEKDRQFYKCRMEEYVRLKEENEFLKLCNPKMNIEHFRIVKENKRKIDNLREENEKLQTTVNNCKQENENLKQTLHNITINGVEEENTSVLDLIKENERLKENQRYHKKGVFCLEYDKETLVDMVDEYKSRCKKAIEYINKHTYNPSQTINDERLEVNPKYLLNILNGDDDKRIK